MCAESISLVYNLSETNQGPKEICIAWCWVQLHLPTLPQLKGVYAAAGGKYVWWKEWDIREFFILSFSLLLKIGNLIDFNHLNNFKQNVKQI